MSAFDALNPAKQVSLWGDVWDDVWGRSDSQTASPPTPAAEPGILDRISQFVTGFLDTEEAPPPPSGWALNAAEGNRDVTGDYQDLVARARAGENTLPDDAQDYVYLNVPGLFTERYPGYMTENAERMKQLGLDPRTVPVDTDAGVEANAQAIRDMVLAIAAEEHRKVVLTGQSKGGVDIAAAMAKYPELQEHVRAVVAMQAPYGGTPIAGDVGDNSVLGPAVNAVIENVFGGDPRSLGDLSYASRQQFGAEHPYPEAVPTVSLATSTDSMASIVAPSRLYIEQRYGLASDGLVPVSDQILPGSDVVRVNGMDHAGSVMSLPGRGDADTPADLTQALLTLALRKASERDRPPWR